MDFRRWMLYPRLSDHTPGSSPLLSELLGTGTFFGGVGTYTRGLEELRNPQEYLYNKEKVVKGGKTVKREIVLTVEVDIGEIVSESEDREDAYRQLSDELESERDRMEREFKRLLRETMLDFRGSLDDSLGVG